MTAQEIILSRTNDVLEDREAQLRLNLLALYGGAPYIDARLCRFPYEPDASWSGNPKTEAQGRKSRAFLVNYAKRAVEKIGQYVFETPAKRDGVDASFAADVTKTRVPLPQFMRSVSALLDACGWCWVSVDRAGASVDAQTGTVRPQSIAQREARGDRVFWTVWQPTCVRDWYFSASGDLEWLITEEELYDNADPSVEVREVKVRTLWRKGEGVRYFITEDEHGKEKVEARPFTLSAKIVPFVPCGTISCRPHWFDDAEMIQAALLNLESVHHENLFQCVYPQLVVPADIVTGNGATGGGRDTEAGDAVRLLGFNYPIAEGIDTKGITRYITPASDGLKMIPDEIQRRKREFFDVVGLAMQNPESRQVASAEAKQWDHLDVEAVLAQRAELLESIERKAVELSRMIDTTFAVYDPVYSREFDISDVQADMQALLQLTTLDLPPSGRKEILRAGVHLLGKIAPIPKERMDALLAEVDAQDVPGVPGVDQGATV